MQNNNLKINVSTQRKLNLKSVIKPKLKATKIDSYLAKIHTSTDNE